MILDSGRRSEFDSGAVRDIQTGKGRCDLMPLDVAYAVLQKQTLFQLGEFQKCGDTFYLYRALKESGVFENVETMLLEVAIQFEEGAEKYGERNWQKGLPVKSYINSAVRHYLKHLRGDTDERHDRAFCWNIMCAAWTCRHKPELNDYAIKNKS